MTEVIVTEDETPAEEVAETVADATEDIAEVVADVAEEVAEAVADAADDATSNGEIERAVDTEHRLTNLENRVSEIEMNYATWQSVSQAQEDAAVAVAIATEAAEDADDATDPEEVSDMIEATEIVEDENGEEHLDAPEDVPAPGAGQHWAFASRRDIASRIADWLKR